jgi:beta-mannanase
MNARWFPWGYKHVRPRVFIAAWRHIHDVMGTAHNVTWVWNPNRANKRVPWAISPPRRWWPGRAYVDWIGIDAYFNSPADTFGSVFGATLANVSGLGAPVLVTETAVAASPQQSRQIQSLVTGVRRHSLLGFVWFDITEREHWYLEDRPAAIAAFRKASGGR